MYRKRKILCQISRFYQWSSIIQSESPKRPILKFNWFFNQLNFFKINALKKSDNPISRSKISISNKFKDYLINRYGIGKRYKSCYKLLEDHNLILKNYNSGENNSTIYIDSFKIKIDNNRSLKYYDSNFMENRISKQPSMTVETMSNKGALLNAEQEELLRIFEKQ